MQLQFIGTGDAFGSGGRFNTCFRVAAVSTSFLIDCGASSMIAMRKFQVDPNAIETIFISHLHGDHFGGLPFLILDAQFYSRRQTPLTLVGPQGLEKRLHDAMEVFFPGSATVARKFELNVREITPGVKQSINAATVTAFEVRHACGAPPFALRIECEGKTIAYSGDTEWTDALIEAGRGADAFIVEALAFEKRISQHLDYAKFLANVERIGAKRILLTHFGPEMLARLGEARHEAASDGMTVEL